MLFIVLSRDAMKGKLPIAQVTQYTRMNTWHLFKYH